MINLFHQCETILVLLYCHDQSSSILCACGLMSDVARRMRRRRRRRLEVVVGLRSSVGWLGAILLHNTIALEGAAVVFGATPSLGNDFVLAIQLNARLDGVGIVLPENLARQGFHLSHDASMSEANHKREIVRALER